MGLAVTYFGIVYRVRLQHVEQLLLAGFLLVDEHLVMGKLPMLVLLDFLDYLRIARLPEQIVVPIGILLVQLVGSCQVEPRPGTHRLRDALPASFPKLWEEKEVDMNM